MHFARLFVSLQAKHKTVKIMEAKETTKPMRTREEILAWLQEARERKQAFQRKVETEWQARQQSKKAAAESGYYNIEWA